MKEALLPFSSGLAALLLLFSVSSGVAQAVTSSPQQRSAVSFEKASAHGGKNQEPIFRSNKTEGLPVNSQRTKNSTVKLTGGTVDQRAVAAQNHYETGLSLQSAGKHKEAIVAFKSAIKLVGGHAKAHFALGVAYDNLKDYHKASESFKLAVRFDPAWPEAHFKLGVVSYVLGRMSAAVGEYKTLVKLNSTLAHLLERIIRLENSNLRVAQRPSEKSPPVQDEMISSSTLKESQSQIVRAETDLAPAPSPTKLDSGTQLALPVDQPSADSASTRSLSKPERSVTERSSPVSQPADTKNTGIDSIIRPVLTDIYKVGVSDVLDIRLLNTPTTRSTLYTVSNGGVIDLPYVGRPIEVVGLTTDEIQTLIVTELKRLDLQKRPELSVGVRQYASHDIIVTGLVNNPGTKFLRREAVPLYVIMAEAQPRPDASRISIMRKGVTQLLDLNDPTSLNFIVESGDVISVSARPQEFYYIAGRIKYPGQKIFQGGITLLQAILAAGGADRPSDNKIELSREAADGRLVMSKFSLKDIKEGKIPDPKVKPGDRIEVVN
jgi:protein involved in polysaccharide export with SLBB domain/Tfp pilus assembly protein PilF